MKSVGIVTYHHAKHSYGASLQALATVRAVEKAGHKAELVNYENPYEQKEIHYKGRPFAQKIYVFLHWCARMFIYGGMKDPCRKRKKLDKIYKNVSKKRYRSTEAMKDVSYDVLLAGSDQIWNPVINGGIDKAFLLDFGKADRKISFASSIGSYKFNDEESEVYKEELSKFDAISVREQYAADALSPLVDKPIKVVCDPTLLLTGDEWRKEAATEIAKNRPPHGYILTYFIAGNLDSYWDRIKDYVEASGLPVWNVQSHGRLYPQTERALHNITPVELISYIENAELILTDSFHGTAFSLNLNKNFVAVINRKNPMRVMNMLERVGLSERIDCDTDTAMKPIDYTLPDEKLEEFRNDSFKWLKDNIG